MKPRSAKKKGWMLEDWMVKWLRNTGLDKDAIRTPGSGTGRFKGDVYTPNLPVIIECKNVVRPRLLEWVQQAEDASMWWQPWLLVWHPPKAPMEGSVVIMSLDLFEKFAKAFYKKEDKPARFVREIRKGILQKRGQA